MKKWTAALLGAILVLGMTACSSDKEASGGANSNTGNEAVNQTANAEGNKSSETVPSVDEFITKVSEASGKIKSFSMGLDTTQNIVVTMDGQTQEQKSVIKGTSDYVKEPLAMYQNIEMDLGELGKQSIEQYITKDGIYSKQNDTWMKMPNEMHDQLMQTAEQSANPEAQLEQFKSIASEAKITQEGDEYLMTADLSGDGVKDLAKSLMSQSGGQNEQSAAMLDQMDLKNIKISYSVNKDTFLPNKTDVQMVMDMEVEGQKVSLDMKMSSTFSKYDEITSIEVPQEAIDNAQSVQ